MIKRIASPYEAYSTKRIAREAYEAYDAIRLSNMMVEFDKWKFYWRGAVWIRFSKINIEIDFHIFDRIKLLRNCTDDQSS